MPGAQADHSREFQIAAGCGKVRLQLNPQATAEGQAGVVEHIAKTGEERSCGGVRRGNNAAKGNVFKLRMPEEIFPGMQRGPEQFRIVQERQKRGLPAAFFLLGPVFLFVVVRVRGKLLYFVWNLRMLRRKILKIAF